MARTRSPSYPGIDLKEAIEKARIIYSNEGQSAALVDTIARHWGYKPSSGSANVNLAALRKFGLVTYEGTGDSRKARLTDAALRIIRDDQPVSRERDEAIRRAALAPAIHKELWKMTQEGASDASLIDFLKFVQSFSDGAAPDLVQEFKRTIAFAKLAETDSVSDSDSDTDLDEDIDLMDVQPEGSGTQVLIRKPQTYRIPLTQRKMVVFQIPREIDEPEWDQMMAVLKAMKPGILSPDDEE